MSFTNMKKNVKTGTPGQGGGQGNWFQRLSSAIEQRGVGDVVSTSAKNLVGGVGQLLRGNPSNIESGMMDSGNYSDYNKKSLAKSKKWVQERSGKDIFAK